ncbi:MAG: ATP-dependent RNA helicase HrpA [Gemmatimonadetes bacterium]|nr:ATP-dependent RNA helicase HrpA [Gemmatimonadota bacterium]MYB61361.1 ATP-dependent RNA helicase HrpA [Gemmatimonadota bacterium]
MDASTDHRLAAEIRDLLPRCTLKDRRDIQRGLKRSRGARGGSGGGARGGSGVRGRLRRLKDQAVASAGLVEARLRSDTSVDIDRQLPISTRKDEILETLRGHPVVIVTGETGSGKTTQLPRICLEAGRGVYGRIACTQPRRVAALSVSRRIAEELGATWGREVGCKIRFTDETVAETRIKMMTDGMLLAEIQHDPDLLEYDTIIIDEAHERSLNIDFLLGYLRLLIRRRKDLKIVVTSATIDAAAFSNAFGQAPVVEVSGRLHPVEIRYLPLEDTRGESEVYTYVDGAVDAVDRIMEEPGRGDILVFLPTEKDIHETRRRLDGRSYRHTDVLPLFGRLTNADQQRVFRPGNNRRIVVATNVAETSLTIPRIKYVVDTGLARISRYAARTRTQRLPIEPIAKSSALQRAGRCGRVSGGVCLRLYSEADLESRPEFTTPELQRANLAEVILRMLALKLGDVHAFPFLDPPTPQAIRDGFGLLAELGAIDRERRLTGRGRDMARLPVSPTVSRMLLQARQEGALQEVLVIASAISIQDPRVRPLDQQEQADAEHRKFRNRTSDFLTLLNIWEAFHRTFEHLQTQGAMRRFCRQHYLSYNRMREWRDIYVQLRRALRESGGFRGRAGRTGRAGRAHFDAIHRSILSGLLSQVAEHREGNLYSGARNRTAMIFPGSGLFRRKAVEQHPEKRPAERGHDDAGKVAADRPRNGTGAAPWIVAAEMVETNRLYARTVARIQPGWAAELGRHLCRASFSDPGWDRSAGRVTATETLHLYGLMVSRRTVDYKKIDPDDATRIFIREALVSLVGLAGLVGEDLEARHDFLEHNRGIRRDAETWLLQHRNAYRVDLDEAAFRFYEERISGVSSVHDLNRLMKTAGADNASFLHMEIGDLTGTGEEEDGAGGPGRPGRPGRPEGFPEHFDLEGDLLPLQYACRPGRDEDGVTLSLPVDRVHLLDPVTLEWLVPGLLYEKIEALLRGLPGRKRKQLVPIPETARTIAEDLDPSASSLTDALAAYIARRHGIEIDPSDWSPDSVPDHLSMRVLVTAEDGSTVLSTRDPDRLQAEVTGRAAAVESEGWRKAAEIWEKYDLRDWSIGDLPERVEIGLSGTVPQYAYPGLQADDDLVDLRLFRDRHEALRESRKGLVRLLERRMGDAMAWLRRDLAFLRNLPALADHAGGFEALQDTAYDHLLAALFTREPLYPLTALRFEEDVETARGLLKKLPHWFRQQMEALERVVGGRIGKDGAYPGMEGDLDRLFPPDFLRKTPAVELPNLVRYLKAVDMRSRRAREDRTKDLKKAERVKPFDEALKSLQTRDDVDPARLDEFRWMLEEYRVSVFAQELGTARTVSPKRLQELLARIDADTREPEAS